ncbi:MAG: YHS domain-containing protein [Armatimonadota bacterium]
MAEPDLDQFIDPVCGMHLDAEEAPAVASYEGHSYYFCSDTHKQEFERDPKTYVELLRNEQTNQQ